MRGTSRRIVLFGVVSLIAGAADPALAQDLPLVRWNDNDRVAGAFEAGVLRLELEVVKARWSFLGEDGPAVEIYAFRERGEAPLNPGPLIRVPLGSAVDVSVANRLDVPITVHGLASRRTTSMDSLVIGPGQVASAAFIADAEGTYYYWGSTGDHGFERDEEDSQLTGAFIVDPTGAIAPENEEILVMSVWTDLVEREGEEDPDFFANENFMINGRPWPHTERFSYALGDTVRWRVINAIYFGHPMHLHGFYFRLDAKGDNRQDRIFWPAERRLGVTEFFASGETAAFTWVAERPGGWIYHCHISYHVVANAAPGQYASGQMRDEALLSGHHGGAPERHVEQGMGGLMLGITVVPPESWRPNETKRRENRLFVVSDSLDGERRRFDYVLAGADGEPPAGPVRWPGSTIVAWKGEPTSVTVINRSPEPTQIHWHGLEIDSYYDGVVGFGGHPGSLTPAIMPADSFEMRITPPRAGSFMYHTHVNDIRQQSAGLYGGFVVLEEGQAWDPEHDRVVLLSTNSDPDMSVLLNGTREPDPLVLTAGDTYRFRIMNITLFNAGARVRLVRDGYAVRWRALAKDGADLPPHQRTVDFADRIVSVGETADFEWVAPEEPAELVLEVRSREGDLFVAQRVQVEAPGAGAEAAAPSRS